MIRYQTVMVYKTEFAPAECVDGGGVRGRVPMRSKEFLPTDVHGNHQAVCLWCGKAGYKTARKPWRHYHSHSTKCADKGVSK